ncbi:MAG: KEOPS complex subunit Pcc1 [Candidatus Bathyarchaeia archaeon]
MEAKIQLSYSDSKEAETVAKAIAPDNVKVPHGLKVETKIRENKVVTRVICETSLQTFTATIDDLLESISVAEDTFNVAKGHCKSQS